MRDSSVRAILLLGIIASLMAVGSAQPLSRSEAGVTVTIPHETYACSPACTINIRVENAGDLNGTLDRFAVHTEFPADARIALSYRNRTGHMVEADTGRAGDTLTLPFDTFWNRTPSDPSTTSYSYRLRLRVTDHSGHGRANITPIIDLADGGSLHISMTPDIAALTPVAPANGTSPGDDRIRFRTRYVSPSHTTVTCGVQSQGSVIAIRSAVRNASTAAFTRTVPPTSPVRWRSWCDWNDDNRTAENELSAPHWIVDRMPPSVSVIAPSAPARFRSPTGRVAIQATDGFTGVNEVRMAFQVDGTNYSLARQPGSTVIPRFGETDTFNASVDVSAFTEGERRLWIWAADAAGNRRVVGRLAVIDLLTATPARYWNRALGLNLSVSNAAYVCSPRCTLSIDIGPPNGTLGAAILASAFEPADPAPNTAARADHSIIPFSPSNPLPVSTFAASNGASATIPVTIANNTRPHRWTLTLSGDSIATEASRGPVTITPWIDDIRLQAPRNNTNPESQQLSFRFTYRSRRNAPVSCHIEYTGGSTDTAMARPGQVTTINATINPAGPPPIRWRTGCDVDADGSVEDKETSAWRWFNDTTAPRLTINFPQEKGATFRGDIDTGVTASDNLGIRAVTVTFTNTETGKAVIDTRQMRSVGLDTYNETIADGLSPGTYEVTFRATDVTGHAATRTTTLTVPEPKGLLPDWLPTADGGIDIGGLLGVLVVIALVLGIGGYIYLRSQVDY